MDYVFNHYFDSLFCSKVDPEKLKEYAKRKASEELARLLMEKAEVETTGWNNGIVVKISF